MSSTEILIRREKPQLKPSKTVGVISDTHVPKRARCIPNEVFDIFRHVNFIIHAGDLVELAVLDELEQVAPVLAVHGNMDSLDVVGALPRINSMKIFDYKIGVMHDPEVTYGTKKMREIAKQNEFNVFVYGHTHTACIRWEKQMLFINPGSSTNPASFHIKPSVGLLKITQDLISPEIVYLTH